VRVFVALALPASQEVVELELPSGSRVEDALAAAHLEARAPLLAAGRLRVGIWGRPCERGTALRDGDRVEIYRSLAADAKAMRRARARVKPSSPRSRSGR